MDEVKGIYSDELGATLVLLLNAGLRVDIGIVAGKLRIGIHGFDEVKDAARWARVAQRLCGVKKLTRNTLGDVTWVCGSNERVELTLFRYLSPRCKLETYEETLPATPERVIPAQAERMVTKTRVVCDEREFVGEQQNPSV